MNARISLLACLVGLTCVLSMPAPVEADCAYSIVPTSRAHSAGYSTAIVTVTTQPGCPWTATSNASWVTLTSDSSGVGSGSVEYAVEANPAGPPRSGTMTIAGLSFTVTQAGVGCSYGIMPASRAHPAAADSGTVAVSAMPGCGWTATSNAAWITVTSGGSGSGNGSVAYSITANASSSPRAGTMTVAGQVFTVTQAGVGCSYGIMPASRAHPAGADSGTVAVSAMPGCEWTATSNAAWITLTSGGSGSGNGSVAYSITANASSSPRAGTMTVAGQVFTVTQAGVGCSYGIMPASRAHPAGADSGTVAVSAMPGCEWTATSNAAWITLTSGSGGSGNGSVAYSISANPSTTVRSGTITVAAQVFTVTQAGRTVGIEPTTWSRVKRAYH